MKTPALVAIILITAAAAHGALDKELEPGLPYLRVKNLARDAPAIAKALTKPCVVLDFRDAEASPQAASALATDLAQTSASHRLRLVLVNDFTAPLLVKGFLGERTGQITFGPKSPAVSVDVIANITSDEDHRAYEAFEKGMSLQELINSTPEKRRYDEAALMRERANGNNVSDSADDPSDAPEKAEDPPHGSENPLTPKPNKAAPPVDLVLQRAVQVYHTLIALNKIDHPPVGSLAENAPAK